MTFLGGLKVKHLALLPILGLIQIFTLMWYVENRDSERLAHEKLVSKHFAHPTEWIRGDQVANKDFLIHRNFKRADFMGDSNDITLVSQCSVDNLHYIPALAKRWNGPISIAIFAPGHEAVVALHGIDLLRKCEPEVKEFVTFHVMYPTAKIPQFTEANDKLLSDDCTEALSALTDLKTKGNYQREDKIKYPQNSLRNLARDNLNTNLFYLVDIDTVPCSSLRHDFDKFATKKGLYENPDMLEAFITPAFEIKRHLRYPDDKQELLDYWENGDAQPFHKNTCQHCHNPTKYDHWKSISIRSEIREAYEIDYYSSYEPFYIGHVDSTPYYDERFKAYGYDRISQVCEMYVKGFKFYVLNNGFIFHIGFKYKKDMHQTKNQENQNNMQIYEKQFKPGLKEKYLNKRECLDPQQSGPRGRAQVNLHTARKDGMSDEMAKKSRNYETRKSKKT